MKPPHPTPSSQPRHSLFGRLLDLLSPRFCCICGQRLSPSEQELCIGCNIALPRTGFAASAEDNPLSRRFWGHVKVERCAALFFYQVRATAKQTVFRFKYKDHPEAAEQFGVMMAREFAEHDFFAGMDCIVPVPLAKDRQRARGYNQSEQLARGISHMTGLPVVARVAQRTAFYGSQTHLNRLDRFSNVAGLFTIRQPQRIVGRHVLVVDDVITTGATTIALAQVLLHAGAARVSIAALACTKHP